MFEGQLKGELCTRFSTFFGRIFFLLIHDRNRGLAILHGFQDLLLDGSDGYLIVFGFVLQVVEVGTALPNHIHRLDVDSGIEIVWGGGSFAGKAHIEASQVAQAHLVTVQEHFTQAVHRHGEHGTDVGTLVHASV